MAVRFLSSENIDGVLTFSTTGTFGNDASITHYTNNYLYIRGGSNGLVVGDNTSATRALFSSSNFITWEINSVAAMHIDSSRNVGIGTTNPQDELHIASSLPSIRLEDIDDNYYHRIRGNGSNLIIVADAGNAASNSSIRFQVDADEKMRITDNGNVGIGTDSPSSLLTLNAASGGALQWQYNGGNYLRIEADSGGGSYYAAAGLYHRFFTSGSERMRIDSNGNVGINDTLGYGKLAIKTSGTFTTDSNDLDFSGVNIVMKTDNTATNAVGSGIVWIKGGSSARKVAAITNYIYGDADQSGLNFYVQQTSSGSSATLSEAMRIDNSGNVIVGGTAVDTAGSTSLKSNGIIRGVLSSGTAESTLINAISGISNGFQLSNDASNNQEYIFHNGSSASLKITSSGNVGIGTTSPRSKFDVNGLITQEYGYAYQIKQGSTEKYYYSNGASYNAFGTGVLGIGTTGDAIQFATNNFVRATINSSGNVGIGTTTNISSPLTVQTDSSANSISIIGRNNGTSDEAVISFYEYDGTTRNSYIIKEGGDLAIATGTGGSPSERMRIDSSGNVGIGTDSPGTFYPGNHNLVVGDGNADSAITVYANPANTSYLLFADGTSGSSTYTAQVRYNHSTNHMEFATNNSTTAKMTLDDTGNVGIGTTSPSYKLDVESDTDSVAGAYIQAGKSSQGEIQNTGLIVGSRTDIATGDYLGISFSGNSSVPARGRAAIGVISTSGASAMDLVFMTRNAGDGSQLGSSDEKMRITSGGELQVTGNGVIRNEESGGNFSYWQETSTDTRLFGQYSRNLLFGTNATERMRITSEGNVALYETLQFFDDSSTPTASAFIHRPTANTLALGTNSSERMRIDSSGNIGMFGQTSPTSYSGYGVLHLGTSSTKGLIKFGNGNTWNGPEIYAIYTGGGSNLRFSTDSVTNVMNLVGDRVGIGTTSPSTKLHIEGASVGYLQTIKNTTAGGDYLQMLAETGDAVFEFNSGGTGGEATLNMYRDGTQYVKISADAGVNNYFNNGANVGIGNTSPGQKLHIDGGGVRVENSGTGLGGFICVGNKTEVAGNYSAYFFGNTNQDTSYFKGGIAYETLASTNGRGDMHFLQDSGANPSNATLADSVMTILNGGNVGIGETSPSNKLEVTTSASQYTGSFDYTGSSGGAYGCLKLRISQNTSPSFIDFMYDPFSTNPLSPIGAIVTTGTGVLYSSFSDYRLKENVADLTGALDKVNSLQPKTFNYINTPETTNEGFLAHELQEIVPQAVSGTKDGVDEDGNPKYQGVDNSHIVPLLVGAIKELKAEIDTLKSQIQ